jgi:hypothetical protein
MNNSLLALIGLRAAALGLAIGGQNKGSAALYSLADAIEAGRASDEHMRTVAEKLKEREITEADWDEVQARTAADQTRLHAP